MKVIFNELEHLARLEKICNQSSDTLRLELMKLKGEVNDS